MGVNTFARYSKADLTHKVQERRRKKAQWRMYVVSSEIQHFMSCPVNKRALESLQGLQLTSGAVWFAAQ